jgi:hypothetical protein
MTTTLLNGLEAVVLEILKSKLLAAFQLASILLYGECLLRVGSGNPAHVSPGGSFLLRTCRSD